MDADEKQKNYQLAEELLSEQNFIAAVIAGVVVMILSAMMYGMAKSASGDFYYSPIALGLGAFIGFAVQFLGRGIDTRFAVVGFISALGAGLLGNMFAVVMGIARATQVWPFDILFDATPEELYDWTFGYLSTGDLMFWVLAIGGAAYFARRPLNREQGLAIHTYQRRSPSAPE